MHDLVTNMLPSSDFPSAVLNLIATIEIQGYGMKAQQSLPLVNVQTKLFFAKVERVTKLFCLHRLSLAGWWRACSPRGRGRQHGPCCNGFVITSGYRRRWAACLFFRASKKTAVLKMSLDFWNSMFWEWVAIRLRMGVPMGVVVWGYRGGVGTLRIRCRLSTYGGFRHTNLDDNLSKNQEKYHHGAADTEHQSCF